MMNLCGITCPVLLIKYDIMFIHSYKNLSTRNLSSLPILRVYIHPRRLQHDDNRLQSLKMCAVSHYIMRIHEYANFLEQCPSCIWNHFDSEKGESTRNSILEIVMYPSSLHMKKIGWRTRKCLLRHNI